MAETLLTLHVSENIYCKLQPFYILDILMRLKFQYLRKVCFRYSLVKEQVMTRSLYSISKNFNLFSVETKKQNTTNLRGIS